MCFVVKKTILELNQSLTHIIYFSSFSEQVVQILGVKGLNVP